MQLRSTIIVAGLLCGAAGTACASVPPSLPVQDSPGRTQPLRVAGDVHVLVVSSDVKDARDLVAAAGDGVITVEFDGASTSLQQLAAMIDSALDGRRAASIGFAAHTGGRPGQLHLNRREATDLFTLSADKRQQDFWREVGASLASGGRIDLLSCDTVASKAGEKLVERIEELSGAQVAASSDATGNPDFGGNWLLERGSVDALAVYLDASRAGQFEGVLAFPVLANPMPDVQINPDHASTVVIPIPATTFSDADGDTFANGRLFYGAAYDQNELTYFNGNFYVFGLDRADHDAVNAETVYLRAWDSGGSISSNYAQDVFILYPDRFPTVDAGIANFSVNEVESGSTSWTIPADAFQDLDGDTLSYSATYDASWISFSGDTFEFFPTDATIPTANTTVSVRAFDAFGDMSNNYAEITFQVTPVSLNDAPALDTTQSPAMPDIDEGITTGANVGASVGDAVVDGSITDDDILSPATPPEAIAITAVDDSNGTWQYWSGASWGPIDDGSLSDDHALLLDAGNTIRFQPDAGFAGFASLTFRAWDKTSGTMLAYGAANPNGGRTAFSAEADTLGITVVPTGVPVTDYSGPSATGSGDISVNFTGGGATCTIDNPQFVTPSMPLPPGVSFPHGLFGFSAKGCEPGAAVEFTVTYPAILPAGTQYWKYGPTPDDDTPHWYVLPATITGNQAVFSITEGGLGDDDLIANGLILDPGGPGAVAATPGAPPPPSATADARPVPAVPYWGLLLLSGLLGWVGYRRR